MLDSVMTLILDALGAPDPGWSGPGRLALKDEDAVSGESASEAVTTKEKDCIPRYRPLHVIWRLHGPSGKYQGYASIIMALNYAGGVIWGRRISFFLVLLQRHSWHLQ